MRCTSSLFVRGVAVLLPLLLGQFGSTSFAQTDTEPPALIDFDFQPRSVDVTSASASVTCEIALSDASSGVQFVMCNVGSSACFADSPSSGTINDGVWTCSATIPENAMPGTWTVASLQVADRANNYASYTEGDLSQRGFPTELEVISGRDVEPPILTAFELDPPSVDVTSGSSSTTCRMSVTDALSGDGVFFASCRIKGPSGAQTYCATSSLSSGTIHDGVWSCSADIRQFTDSGTWVVSEVLITDAIGNHHDYFTDELAQLGFSTELQVTSNSDIEAPVLAEFDFHPRSVDVSVESASVTCELALTDPLAGVIYGSCSFVSPSRGFSTSCLAETPSTGSIHDGVWSCSVTIPRGAEPGTWIALADVADGNNNYRRYQPDDLDRLGFPAEIEVTVDTSNRDSDGDGVADPYDECADTRMGGMVVIEDCNSGVPDPVLSNGCAISQEISQCANAPRNHGRFTSCVARLTRDRRIIPLITRTQIGRIRQCAARAH